MRYLTTLQLSENKGGGGGENASMIKVFSLVQRSEISAKEQFIEICYIFI